jgi:hypothetical protein
MALLQIRRGNSGTKGTLQYGEPFFNSSLQTIQIGASGSEEITLVRLNNGLAPNAWGESGSYQNSGSLSLTGDVTASNAFFRGNVFVSGNITLGNIGSGQATSSDSITVIADFTSDLVPNESSSYNLGSANRTWANVYTDDLLLTAISGIDARYNILYVSVDNKITASNSLEFDVENRLRVGANNSSSFTVDVQTANTFISGNLQVAGNQGILVSGSVSSSDGFIFAQSGTFSNLNPGWNPNAANNGLVFTQGGALVNKSSIRYFDAQEQFNIGNDKFTVDGNNGNTFTSGSITALGEISGSSLKIGSTVVVGGGSIFNNSVQILGNNGNLTVNKDLRVQESASIGTGLTVTGSVLLNAGNIGTTQIRGRLYIGSSSVDGETSISGAFSQEYSGSALEVLHRRISPFRNASLIFDDDTSPIIAGAPGKIVLRNQSADTNLDAQITTGVTSSGISVTNATAGGSISIGYSDTNNSNSIRINIGATNGIALNSRTQIASNLSVSGSTILGQGGDDLLTIASPTTMSGDVWNQAYIANLGDVKISASLEVTGSTLLLGTVTMGDLRTQSGSGILGSASFDSDVRVGRDLYVNGTKASFKPKLIQIASGSTAAFEAEGAGLFISGASAQFVYAEAGDRMFLNKGLKIDGDAISGFGLQVSASTYLSGNLEVSGNLDVYGDINLSNVIITNTASIQELVVVNDISGGRDLRLKRNISVTGSSNILLNQAITGALDVNGATRLASTLNVVGAVGLSQSLNVIGSTAITGGLFVSGNTTLSSSLRVKEDSFFDKNLTVSGNLTVDGDVNILGDIVSINVSNLQIEDKNIQIARGSLSSLQSDDAGITIEGPTTPFGDGPIKFTWDHANQRMNLNKNFNISGSFLIQGDDIIDTAVALAIALG